MEDTATYAARLRLIISLSAYSKTAIIAGIRGPHADAENNRILRVNMANIRRKIEENPAAPKYIFTEVGVGYRMAPEKRPDMN